VSHVSVASGVRGSGSVSQNISNTNDGSSGGRGGGHGTYINGGRAARGQEDVSDRSEGDLFYLVSLKFCFLLSDVSVIAICTGPQKISSIIIGNLSLVKYKESGFLEVIIWRILHQVTIFLAFESPLKTRIIALKLNICTIMSG
jgi:hypothetical protein